MEKKKGAPADKAAASSKKKAASAPAEEKRAKAAKVLKAPEGKAKAKAKPPAEKKPRVIRDSFTLPEEDYARLSQLKQVCLKGGVHVKKSELVRTGLRVLSGLDSAQLLAEVASLEKIKTGRPKTK